VCAPATDQPRGVPTSEVLVRTDFPAYAPAFGAASCYDRLVPTDDALPKDPVIEAYKRDVDVSLLVENLRRTPQERMERMIAMLRLSEELRRGMSAAR
jgi:hypothetical protein